MKVYDVNQAAGLALVADDEGMRNPRYIPMKELPEGAKLADTERTPFVYLKQMHYVARAHAAGVVVARVDDMLNGWKQYDDWAFLYNGLRSKHGGER